MDERPFNQSLFNLEIIRLPPSLSGYAYKFTLTIPLLFEGREVFSGLDKVKLLGLLTEDFGGCTCTEDIVHPLFAGTWIDEQGNIVKNNNAMYVIYATQTDKSKEYFKTLQLNLQKSSGEEKILIEMIPVTLL